MKALPVLALIAAIALLACKGGWSRPPLRPPDATATAEAAERRARERAAEQPAAREPDATPEAATPAVPELQTATATHEAPQIAAPVPDAPSTQEPAPEPLPVPVLFPPDPEDDAEESDAELAARILDGETFSNAPPGSGFARIEPGMSDSEVLAILGDPDAHRNYTTLKRWIPFYAGPDAQRTDWLYRGQGTIVFSRDLTRPDLLAIQVVYQGEAAR